jgi:uncharacterized protein (DUF1501 family)
MAAAGYAAASFNRLSLMSAMAQSSQDYKALVCIFMFGGNDSNNMIVPNYSCQPGRAVRVSSAHDRTGVAVHQQATGGDGQCWNIDRADHS